MTYKENPVLAHVKNKYERMTLKNAERALIEAALARNNGKVNKAAEQLGVTRATLYNKMLKLGKSVKQWRTDK